MPFKINCRKVLFEREESKITACCVDQQTTIQEQINVKIIIPVIAPHDEVYGNNACVQCFIGL